MSALICWKKILSLKSLTKLSRKEASGYYVLVPEIGDDLPEKYPLLKEETMLPEFNEITIEKCIAAIAKQTLDFEKGIKQIDKELEGLKNVNVFTDIFNKIEALEGPLKLTWGISKTLYYGHETLIPNSCYASINKRAQASLVNKYLSKNIFNALKQAERDTRNLTNLQRQMLKKYILECELAGTGLNENLQKALSNYLRLIDLKKEKYNSNVQFATYTFKHKINDPSVMQEFPVDFLKTVAIDPLEYEVGPWVITLHPKILETFLAYCPNSLLRWNVWQANNLRCSAFGDQNVQNHKLIYDILNNKNLLAQSLGFKNYIEMSMPTKMVGNIKNLKNFLDSSLAAAFPHQEREIAELQDFACKEGFKGKLEQWDIPYWMRKQKLALYNYNEETLTKYFPLTRVIINTFRLIRELFNVEIIERQKVQGWNNNVHFFDVFDPEISMSKPVGSFYLDPLIPDDEDALYRNMNSVLLINNRSDICGLKPLSSLILTLKYPNSPEDNIYMSFDDVRQFIANMGILLQQLLTKVEHIDLAGLSFVEWDAVNVTKHVMENWAYDPQFLKRITYNPETNGPLDDATIQKIIDSRYHMPGYHLCQELYLSSLDIELYSNDLKSWENIVNQMWQKHFVVPHFKKDSYVCSWTKLFIEQNGSSYYCDLWSKMIAADVYSAFEECRDDPKMEQMTYKRFKDTYFSLGGSVSAQEVFRRFRGRDPNYDVFYKSMKLK
ncbi:PREDICTED: probable cytosolic oligopeptidase A [Ceratosolen solmsi marchali]|uniref:Probable cytosolic oligopeptidase A n=1 Tax=Ceratosolen solmsi marchali TaxID=326594 RepID=A0AAJ6YV41_9HYME|nr:PREDICTED: probable cytosolic oligopeptidase A [Ceratosolen solmsi marchali]